MYALDLMYMHVHNDHMDVYDFCFVLISMLNDHVYDFHVDLYPV